MKTPRVELVASAANRWQEFKEAVFYEDGSLRDICVQEIQLEDWNRAAQYIVTRDYQILLSGPWHQLRFPDDLERLFTIEVTERPVLGIEIGGVTLICHFFDPSWIEFDLDPSEVDGPEKIDVIFSFLRGLAAAIGKRVDLTEENVPDATLFRALPEGSTIQYMNYSN